MKQQNRDTQDSRDQQRKQAEAKAADPGVERKDPGAGGKKLEGPNRPST